MKTLKTLLMGLTLTSLSMMSVDANAQSSKNNDFHQPITHKTITAINTPEQMLWYVNAQNLLNTWNNIIIDAKTGKEQLKVMNESGVFAKDVKLTFNFFGQESNYTGLEEEPLDFYSGFVDPLKKKRTNIASNFEVVAFESDALILNFKHFIFFDETLSLVGQNQVVVKRNETGYYVAKAYIDVRLANLEHGY